MDMMSKMIQMSFWVRCWQGDSINTGLSEEQRYDAYWNVKKIEKELSVLNRF